jgi:putative ABC transport system permease protein
MFSQLWIDWGTRYRFMVSNGCMLKDLRFAVRVLGKSPSFLITAVVSLALGIGATTVMFSAFRAVFLRPLSYPDPDRLVEISKVTPDGGGASTTTIDVQFWRQFSRTFESFGTFAFYHTMTLSGREPASLVARVVEPDLFRTLQAQPLLGRTFVPADFENSSPHGLLLTWKIWQSQFNGDRGVVGRQVMLDHSVYTIIGVMPREFQFPTPFSNVLIADRGITDPRTTARGVIGRLKQGISPEAALAELERMRPALAQLYPEAHRNFRFRLDLLGQRDAQRYRTAFLTLSAAVGLLALIACLNVANLIIARSMARESEFAIRSALGAARRRLMRQVFVESLTLAAAGGALGVLLAWIGNRVLVTMLPTQYQVVRLLESRIDVPVLWFALTLTTATALVFGTGPALVLSRFSLREMGRTTTPGAARKRWRGALAAAEVALSLILLIGAGLLIRSFAALAGVDPGFRPDHVLTAMIPVSHQLSKDKPKLVQRLSSIVDRVEALPGVTAAGISTAIPMGTVRVSLLIELPGHKGGEVGINYRAVSPEYFRALGIPLRLGRLFTAHDNDSGASVAIINEAFARKYWPGQNPIGQKLGTRGEMTVVGVVGDQHQRTLDKPAEPEFYHPYQQYLGPALGTMLVVRTQEDPARMAASLRQTVHQAYPDQPVSELMTMEERVSESMAEPRLYTSLLGIFAAIALALTAIGVYGIMAYSVGQRVREFGIRMALGAQRTDVLRVVLRSGLTLVGGGAAAGIAGAWVFSRYVESMLFGVAARDPVTFVAAPVLLLAVAAIACYFPAKRATSIDPNHALREG